MKDASRKDKAGTTPATFVDIDTDLFAKRTLQHYRTPVLRETALFLLIVSIASAVQSDADGPDPPRRIEPPVSAARLPNASDDQEHTTSPAGVRMRRVVDSIAQFPFPNGDEGQSREPTERPPEAVEIFHCDFGQNADTNFDNWPDRWVREHSVDYPHYLPIHIADEPSPASKRSVRVDLNGGAAAIHTPPIKVDALYTYVVEGYIQTRGLKHDEASLILTFLDANNKPLESVRSNCLRRTTGWTKVRIGPIASTSKKVQSAVVTLHLGPGEKTDLRGSAWFSDIWLGRLPRMTLTADRRSHLYYDEETPEITCAASGFREQHSKVIFELIDVHGNVVARSEERLVPHAASAEPRPAASSTVSPGEEDHRDTAGSTDEQDSAEQASAIFAGAAVWEPAIPHPGFYRVRVEMPGRTGVANQRQMALAVVKRLPPPPTGEFGWSLPRGEEALSLVELAEVLGHSGSNWCKFPLWDESHPADREEQLVWFAERLGLRHIELVGLLSEPPADVKKQLVGAESQQAAGIFSMPTAMWYPSLEPIMTRLSLKVRWWQLGLDRDQSFVGYPELAKKISQLKKQFARYGQRIYLGMGWSWMKELPEERPTWDFLCFSAEPALTWEEQLMYLRATKDSGSMRWVVLDPLPREHYLLETRARDLAMRMIAAKMERAEGVFVPQVLDDSTGLLNRDGTVGELFVPWRTTAHVLAGAQPLGSLQLPSNCRTQVFHRADEVVMAVWSDQPTKLRLFLGDEARQIDLWGRESAVAVEDGIQVIDVGPTPIFVTQINAPLMRTQMSVQFDNTKLASLFGKAQSNALLFKNHFPQPIRGQARIITPDTWRASPKDIPFKTSPAETIFQQFEVSLQPNAATGRQLLRLDFDITADRRYQFSIYRQMDVGLSDIFGEAFTRLNEKGELEVEQRITNETDEVVSFKSYLYFPAALKRKRMMMHVEDHGRGVDVKTFRVYNGEEVIGHTLFLRAEEVNGSRILNYSVTAQP